MPLKSPCTIMVHHGPSWSIMCYFLSLNIVGVVSSALKGEGIYIPISRGLALEIILSYHHGFFLLAGTCHDFSLVHRHLQQVQWIYYIILYYIINGRECLLEIQIKQYSSYWGSSKKQKAGRRHNLAFFHIQHLHILRHHVNVHWCVSSGIPWHWQTSANCKALCVSPLSGINSFYRWTWSLQGITGTEPIIYMLLCQEPFPA